LLYISSLTQHSQIAPKTKRLLSGHILPRNASNFTCCQIPGPVLTGARKGKGGGEGVKGFLSLKGGGRKGQGREEGRESRGVEGPAAGGNLAPRSYGIDAPGRIDTKSQEVIF